MTLQPGAANDWFGWSIATGDFDGDNATDLAVGAPGTNNATGNVRIWFGDFAIRTPSAADFSIDGSARATVLAEPYMPPKSTEMRSLTC